MERERGGREREKGECFRQRGQAEGGKITAEEKKRGEEEDDWGEGEEGGTTFSPETVQVRKGRDRLTLKNDNDGFIIGYRLVVGTLSRILPCLNEEGTCHRI